MEPVPCVFCSSASKDYCTCKTPHINFWRNHLDDHECSPGHHRISLLYPNTLPVNVSTKLQLLDKLNEVSSSSKLQIQSYSTAAPNQSKNRGSHSPCILKSSEVHITLQQNRGLNTIYGNHRAEIDELAIRISTST